MDNQALQQLTESISLNFFEKPFQHQVTFNKRLRTTGGRYLLSSHNIEINPKQYEFHGKEALIDIIKHELVHYHLHIAGLGFQHRDRDFKVLSEKVGAPRYCNPLPNNKHRYVFTCTGCSTQYFRQRRINIKKYRCSKCLSELQLTRKV
ncbi:SprT family protein [Macrococcus sp. DPC7161]|uniref:SprT family protein n=1 Tax=Macrococcus sp. DPC7161 TaxID=2507060 RepID=UPI00100B08EF|nr:SprT family protein [Macrococcus sp. DPC7161]RXK17528.1 SprT family protein [Macrococcus sp. DPC7161]